MQNGPYELLLGLAAFVDLGDDGIAFYKKQCQYFALDLMEEAWSFKE
jgi:hypothetical protein